ncbi:putative transcription factor & chromatin remodeling ARID family [Helianthus anomalus]
MFKPKTVPINSDLLMNAMSGEQLLETLGDSREHNNFKQSYLETYFEYLEMSSNQDKTTWVNEPWVFRDQIKDGFLQMVAWFLHFYLRSSNRPIPSLHGKGKKIELYDLYIIVKKEGHKRVSQYNLWVVVAKNLGLDYQNGDMVRLVE